MIAPNDPTHQDPAHQDPTRLRAPGRSVCAERSVCVRNIGEYECSVSLEES